MTTQKRIKQALFPDYPRHPQTTNTDGTLTPKWNLGLSSVFQALQKNYKNEGIMIPVLNQDEQDKIEALYNGNDIIGKVLPGTLPDISGQMIMDDTNIGLARVPKIFIITYKVDNNKNVVDKAAWKTFTVT